MNDLMAFELEKLKGEKKLAETEINKTSNMIAEMLRNGMGEEIKAELSNEKSEIETPEPEPEHKQEYNLFEKIIRIFNGL